MTTSSSLALALLCLNRPSVGVDTRPLAEEWRAAERDHLTAALLTRLHEDGYPVAQEGAAVDVNVVPLGENRIEIVVKSSFGARVIAVDAPPPRGLVTLHVVHRVMDAVETLGATAVPPDDARMRVRLVAIDRMTRSEALAELVRRDVVVLPPSTDEADAMLCVLEAEGVIKAYPSDATGDCDSGSALQAPPLDAWLATSTASTSAEDAADSTASSGASSASRSGVPPEAPDGGPSPSNVAPSSAPSGVQIERKTQPSNVAPSSAPSGVQIEGKTQRNWDYDVAILAQLLFRGALPPARGVDGGAELILNFTHTTGWGMLLSTRFVPSRSGELWVLESFVSAGPSYRVDLHRRALLAVSVEGGVLFHDAWYRDEDKMLDVAPYVRLPVRIIVPLTPHLRLHASVHAGYAPYRRRHLGPANTVLWDRYGFSGGIAVGLGGAGRLP